MGRKIISEVEESARAMDLVLAEEEKAELTKQQALELYGDEQEYERLRIMEEAKTYVGLAQKAVIEAGKRFILLKTHEDHGSFLSTLEQIGVDVRTAQNAMKIARIFGKYENFSHLPAAKLNALELLSSDELDDLSDGDEVSGITLDKIDTMTAKEIKSALRKEKNEHENERTALEKIISEKNSKLNELEMELAHRQPPTKQDYAQAKLDEFHQPLFSAILEAIHDISAAVSLMDRACRIEDLNIDQLMNMIRVLSPHFASLKESYDTLTDYVNNLHPIKEAAPCTKDM